MKLNIIMIINAVVALIYGIAFVLVPVQVLSMYGVAGDAPVAFMSQLFGATLIGFAVLSWSARNAVDSDARRAIVLALFIAFAVGFMVALMGALEGFMNPLSWLTVVIYLFFASCFGYFQFVPPKSM